MRKGQGTFEYVLLLAGVLLIVVLAIVLLRGGIFGAGAKDVQFQACKRALAQSGVCYYQNGSWNPSGAPSPLPDACIAYNNAFDPDVTNCGEQPA